jgi:snapalysin
MRFRTSVMSAIAGLGLAATLGTVPAATAATPHTAAPAHAAHYTGYAGGKESAKANRAFFEAVLKSVAEKRAAHPDLTSVTITYDASQAPSFANQIASSTSIWNSSVHNVRLQAGGSGSDFAYYEGSDPEGSYASTDGHGHGYIFIDYAQSQEYNSTRIVAHETGHVLGLPDDYSGPCSELMSGGGPGPSCQNTYPDANEIAEVDALWANGFQKALDKLEH